jgi:hypothetical protein
LIGKGKRLVVNDDMIKVLAKIRRALILNDYLSIDTDGEEGNICRRNGYFGDQRKEITHQNVEKTGEISEKRGSI